MVQANLPETSPFFICPNDLGKHLFPNVYRTWDVKFGYSEKATKFEKIFDLKFDINE